MQQESRQIRSNKMPNDKMQCPARAYREAELCAKKCSALPRAAARAQAGRAGNKRSRVLPQGCRKSTNTRAGTKKSLVLSGCCKSTQEAELGPLKMQSAPRVAVQCPEP